MARTWTEEQRKAQAEAIKRWQPWKKSTGPKTPAGKARARRNALKNGLYTPEFDHLRQGLRLQRAFLAHVLASGLLGPGAALKGTKYYRTAKKPNKDRETAPQKEKT